MLICQLLRVVVEANWFIPSLGVFGMVGTADEYCNLRFGSIPGYSVLDPSWGKPSLVGGGEGGRSVRGY